MLNSEDAHSMTENIYKNLATKFNPQAKLMLANGKAYHKALLATSSAARAYIESLGRLGHECRTNGRGGTEELGQAIFRIAEVYKEIQMKFEDCTKALFAEIVLPLEQKLENEFKNAAAEQRKYHQGHKEFYGPYNKSMAALEKFRKKNQSKGMYDEEKEAPLAKAALKYQEKLDEFRLQGLKLAMLEERKCYCFVLSQLTAVATVQLHYHDRGLDCLTDDLATWRQMSSQAHMLPRSADAYLRISNPASMNGGGAIASGAGGGGLGMGYSYKGAELGVNHRSPYRQVQAKGDYHPGRPPSEYSDPSQSPHSQTLQRRPMLPHAPPQGPQVKAVYPHVPTHEGQLRFNVGETMTLVGEPSDGWNYAYNPVSDEYGWLPLAYVESAPRQIAHTGPPPRAKSISDLKEHSLVALTSSLTFDPPNAPQHNVPGTTRRPKSLHEPAMMKMINDAFGQPMGSETSSVHSSSTVSSQVSQAGYMPMARPYPDNSVYQPIPGEQPDMASLHMSAGIYSADGQPLRPPPSSQMMFSGGGVGGGPPSPPLPPPPTTSHYSGGHQTLPGPSSQLGMPGHDGGGLGGFSMPNTPMVSNRPRSNSLGTYLPHSTPTPIFSIPPPPSFNAPLPPGLPPNGAGRIVPPPVSQKTSSVLSMTSQSMAGGGGIAPPPPPPPPPVK